MKTFLFLAISLISLSQTAHALTKFACCTSENVSCLGGGGATIWHTTLRDRAFTQIDAYQRCGLHKMRWNTHSCPASTACPDEVPNNPAPTAPVAPAEPYKNQVVTVNNTLGVNAYLVFDKVLAKDYNYTYSWTEVRPGQQTKIDYPTFGCLGISVNGRDRVQDLLNANNLKTTHGTSEIFSHPNSGTTVMHEKKGINYNSLEVILDRTKVFSDMALGDQAVTQAKAKLGLTPYKCIIVPPGANYLNVY